MERFGEANVISDSKQLITTKGINMSQLKHHEIQKIVEGLSSSKVINLDASLRQLIEPVAQGLMRDPGSEVGLHVLCCNEYALVTGLQNGQLSDLGDISTSLKTMLKNQGMGA
jgi:hypothetical protein